MMGHNKEVAEALAWLVENAPRFIIPFVNELRAANLEAIPDFAALTALGGFIDGMAEWALEQQRIPPRDPAVTALKLQIGMAGWDYAEQMVATAREIH